MLTLGQRAYLQLDEVTHGLSECVSLHYAVRSSRRKDGGGGAILWLRCRTDTIICHFRKCQKMAVLFVQDFMNFARPMGPLWFQHDHSS